MIHLTAKSSNGMLLKLKASIFGIFQPKRQRLHQKLNGAAYFKKIAGTLRKMRLAHLAVKISQLQNETNHSRQILSIVSQNISVK